MEANHSVLHAVYMHFKDKNKGKSPCVSLISHVFSFSAACVSVSSHFSCKKASLQCVFPVFLVVFGHDLLYWEFKNRYSKKPVYVTKKISVTTFINSFMSAYDSTAQDLAARIHQK